MQTRDEETKKFFKHSSVHCLLILELILLMRGYRPPLTKFTLEVLCLCDVILDLLYFNNFAPFSAESGMWKEFESR